MKSENYKDINIDTIRCYLEAIKKANQELMQEYASFDLNNQGNQVTKKKSLDNDFSILVENAPDIICRFNKELRFTYINNAVKKELLKHPSCFTGKKIWETTLEPQVAALFSDKVFQVFRTGKETSIEIGHTVDNATRYFFLRLMPEFDSNWRVESVLCIARNITEYKEALIELTEARDRALETDRLKSAFLSNISHEIRTPMNAIIGFANLLGNAENLPVQLREYAELIIKSGDQLLNIIDTLIDLARLEAGQLEINHSNLELHGFLDELRKQHSDYIATLGKNELVINLNLPDCNDFHISVDTAKLRRIFENLLDNAIKFSNKGYIEIGYEPLQGDTVKFFVKDTGIGIPDDKLHMIFDRFTQADNSFSRKYGGIGLGLTISRGIIEFLGGKIWVISEYGKGSAFYFTLPAYHSLNQVTPAVEVEDDKMTRVYSWPGKRILIAEDEDSNYIYLKESLLDTKLEIVPAKNGQEAIDLINSGLHFDLVLMDMKMPVVTGFEATRVIKQTHPDIPIIAQTAYSMDDERKKCLEAGCDDYITKPISQAGLLGLMKKYFK
ncbi:MAG: ATP-binding protein [Bacteroidales bacterium]